LLQLNIIITSSIYIVGIENVKELLAYYENLQRMIREVRRRRIPLLKGLQRGEAESA
jgi:hypothetical protein